MINFLTMGKIIDIFGDKITVEFITPDVSKEYITVTMSKEEQKKHNVNKKNVIQIEGTKKGNKLKITSITFLEVKGGADNE